MKLKQRDGNSARQMPLQPFSAAANIDKLYRPLSLHQRAHVRAPIYRDAGEFDTLLAPLLLVCQSVTDCVLKADSRQSIGGFVSGIGILGNQKKPLDRIDKDRCPTCEIPGQTDLNRSMNVKLRELLCRPCIEDQSFPCLFLDQLRYIQFTKFCCF